MSSDFESYEQEFGTLTAEVTNKIGKIPKLSGEDKTQLVLNVDKQLEEVRELESQTSNWDWTDLPKRLCGEF